MISSPLRRSPARSRRALIAGLAGIGVLAGVSAALVVWRREPHTHSADAVAAAPRELRWEEMVPADWNPSQGLDLASIADLKDSDPRAQKLLDQIRERWDSAPANSQLAGARVRLPGFVVPLELEQVSVREFLLVPYFGACIHTPPPPANQIVQVRLKEPARALRAMDAVHASGTMKLVRSNSAMGVSAYTLEDASITPYSSRVP